MSEELSENASIARELDSDEQKSTPNTSSLSSLGLSSSLEEVEESEVNQLIVAEVEVVVPKFAAFALVPISDPILVDTSNLEALDNLDHPLVHPMVGDVIKHSFT